MTSAIHLGDGLSLPLDVVTQTIAIVAKRRAGKSYLARLLVEQLHRAGQQVVVVDPKGDWWGLRSSADGKGAGLPILILGGERGDAPLEPASGEVVAKLIVEERVSALIDLSLLRKHEVATFCSTFLETLYRLKAREVNRTPCMLIVDEADAIAPQKPQPNEARMLGAIEDVVRRGGQRGLGCTLVTQRTAVLNKNVLTQAQVLVALRTIAPQDLKAMQAWIDVHGEPEQQRTLMGSLAALPVGTAWFWSPGWPTTEGVFQRVKVSRIETFDSGATPKPGERRHEPKTVAEVDLEAVRRQMADVVERAKADDPKTLRARIAELEKELRAALVPKPDPVEVVSFDKAAYALLWNHVQDEITSAHADVERRLGAVSERVAERFRQYEADATGPACSGKPRVTGQVPGHAPHIRQPRFPVVIGVVSPSNPRLVTQTASAVAPNGLGKCSRAILGAVVQHGPISLVQAAIIAGYASDSGGVRNAAGELRAGAWVFGGNDRMKATPKAEALGFEPLPTGTALAEYWIRKLGKCEGLILDQVIGVYPKAISLHDAATRAGYEPDSGGVRNAAGKLRTLMLIEGGNSGMTANENLIG